ncbi:MAG: AAA family ATPase [Anaerolineae bacterium]
MGTSGSGKTSTAGQIAAKLNCPHIELDALHWEPGWQEAPLDVFRARVIDALTGDRWVVDGNYSKVRDVVWPRADTVVWLDYPFLTVLRQLVWRTVRRITRRELLWGTNRESLRALFSRDSIILWMLQTYHRRRREYPELFRQAEHAHLTVIRLTHPAETRTWLDTLSPDWTS